MPASHEAALEAIASIRETAARQIASGATEPPAERARRLAETGIMVADQLSAIADQTTLLALIAATRPPADGSHPRR